MPQKIKKTKTKKTPKNESFSEHLKLTKKS